MDDPCKGYIDILLGVAICSVCSLRFPVCALSWAVVEAPLSVAARQHYFVLSLPRNPVFDCSSVLGKNFDIT